MKDDQFAKEMGERLLKIRKDLGLNQIQFAQALEISQAGYNAYERGQRETTVSVLTLLYHKFNVNPTWMLCGTGTRYMLDEVSIYDRIGKINEIFESFLAKNKCEVSLDKRLKMTRWLLQQTENTGEIDHEMVEKYLTSAI